MHPFFRTFFILLLMLAVAAPFARPYHAQATIVDDLKNKIVGGTADIQKLEEEIAAYQDQLTSIGKQKATLKSAVQTIDITRNKLSADISLTGKKINQTKNTVQQLDTSITLTQQDVNGKTAAIKTLIRKMNQVDDLSMAELAFSSDSISDVWNDMEAMRRFEETMNGAVNDLLQKKTQLQSDKQSKETQQNQLQAYQSQLSDQKAIADQNRAEKNTILQQTKNQESTYQAKLAEKKRLKDELEKQILNYESQLKIALDPNSFPTSGSGVLAWPLDKVIITQFFGNTPFAQSGAYNGSGHNGVDMGIPVGTPVKAALSGTVQGTGNTDAYPGCYSFGKWVLIKHANGLSTLYAHFSLIKVSAGQAVSTGDIIGYSGNTGYSTGPHLHFGVYASQGVQIVKMGDIKKSTNCAGASVPVASLNAYMNPLDYLVNGNKYR